jgi:3-hydroxyisobutyrate dehydrogenase-like beta-hydroxyacid dehydrogenase
MKFGFVGLGQMGAPMAANLARHHAVIVFNRDARKSRPLAERGADVAEALTEIGTADVILLCLSDGEAVEAVLFGPDGLAAALKPGTVVVDTSTVSYALTLSICARLHEAGIGFIDAPVSGMRARAEAGTLTMMCGGEAELVNSLREPLSAMASEIFHMGPAGSGQLTKLVNQLLFDINAAALAEIMPFAVKLGLDPVTVSDVVNSGSGRSFASETFLPNILKGDFGEGYPMRAAYKDLVSGAEIGAQRCIPMPVLAAATATYQQAMLAGHGDKDKGGMIRLFEDLLGVAFRETGATAT